MRSCPRPAPTPSSTSWSGSASLPPLDRSKPLWELWLVEGFEDERFAIVYKTHHALADGISAVDIGVLLFDVEPKFEPVRDETPWKPNRPPSRLRLVGRALSGLAATVVRTARWLSTALQNPGRARKRAADGLAGLWEVTWALTKPAPKVPINVEIGPHRSFSWTQMELAEFKWIKNALGGTVNDVSLAVTAGAVRRWLQDRGLDPDELPMRALVPVSVRTEDEHGELGNRLTAMRGPLPVHIADPVRRLHTVAEGMDALKASKQPLGAEAIWNLNDWFRDFAPPFLLGPTAGINFSTRLFNMLVTNFPGPQIPFYVSRPRADRGLSGGLPRTRSRARRGDLQLQRLDPLRPARRPRHGLRPRNVRRPHRGLGAGAARGRPVTLQPQWQRSGGRSSTSARGRARRAPRSLRPKASGAASSDACARASRRAARH